jgi:hypothetical protein
VPGQDVAHRIVAVRDLVREQLAPKYLDAVNFVLTSGEVSGVDVHSALIRDQS